MAKPTAHPSQNRRRRGFEPAFSLVANRVRQAGEARGFAVARLLTDWAEVVGAEIAARSRPVKISHGKGFGATLTLLTTGAQAPLVEMEAPRIRERVNACYGYNAIARVRITQTAPTGFAEGQAIFAPAPKPQPAPPDPARLQAARAAGEGIEDPTLRAALERLALNLMSRPDRGAL